MASQSEERFTNAWKALDGQDSKPGWNTLPIRNQSSSLLLAGRQIPKNQESLLIGFSDARLPKKNSLPQCKGFIVDTVELDYLRRQYGCLAITRQPSASLELFGAIVEDVVSVLERGDRSEQEQVRAILDRIVAWQKFMSREDDGILKGEQEVGLLGELQFLRLLLDARVDPITALESWLGPLDALHDFVAPHGDVEVKASIRGGSFTASISSLDQLDESLVVPLYLAAIQFGLSASGLSLPDFVAAIAEDMRPDDVASRMFEGKLLSAGYHPYAAGHYHRKFKYLITNIYEVGPELPHLSKSSVPKGVVEAIYRVELDASRLQSIPLTAVLPRIGYANDPG